MILVSVIGCYLMIGFICACKLWPSARDCEFNIPQTLGACVLMNIFWLPICFVGFIMSKMEGYNL